MDKERIRKLMRDTGIVLTVFAALVTGSLFLEYIVPKSFFYSQHKDFVRKVESVRDHKYMLVKEKLGEPLKEIAAEDIDEGGYYYEGYTYRRRPISNKVLVYVREDAIAYIWIDKRGLVEDIYIGPS